MILSKLTLSISLLLAGSNIVFSDSLNYQSDVLPILKKHCLGCHNPDKRKADLDLSSYSALLVGSSGGEIVKAGVPDTSPLFMSVDHHEDYEPMPPNKPKLTDKELKIIKSWIEGGLIEAKGGESMLRDIQINLAVGSSLKPTNPAWPQWTAPVKSFAGSPILSMDRSPWADLYAVGVYGRIILWGYKDSKPVFIGELAFPEGNVNEIRFSRSGEILLVAGGQGAYEGKVALYDVKTGKRLVTVGNENDEIISSDLSPDHQRIAIGTTSRMIKVLDASSGKQIYKIDKHTDWVTQVRFDPTGKYLASGDRNGGIHVWESSNGGIVYSLNEHKVRINSLSWRTDGGMLASAGEDGKFVLWDMKDGWPVRTASPHSVKSTNRYTKTTGILDLRFDQEGRFLTFGRDKSLQWWQGDGTNLGTIKDLQTLNTKAVFAMSGDIAVSADVNGRLWEFDLTKKTTRQLLFE